MPAKKSKKQSATSLSLTEELSISLNSADAVPWFNQRYLLPGGEQLTDYDQQLQLLIDSVEVKDALDLILVKDIHDELREVQHMRRLRQSTLLRGMAEELGRLLQNKYTYEYDPRAVAAFTEWERDSEQGYQSILALLDEANVTKESLMADAFSLELKKLKLIDEQLARHEKNVRETLKMIDVRRNHAVMRKRLEFDLEQDRQQLLNNTPDGNT